MAQLKIICPSLSQLSNEIFQMRNDSHIDLSESLEIYLTEKLGEQVERTEGVGIIDVPPIKKMEDIMKAFESPRLQVPKS